MQGSDARMDDRRTGAAIVRLGIIVFVIAFSMVAVFFIQDDSDVGGEGGSSVAGDASTFNGRRFVDATERAGLTFIHNNGARGEKLLPETMGGGIAFLDFDGDGDQDLFLVNSSWWPWDVAADSSLIPTTSALYRNDSEPGGNVRFTDVTRGSGLEVAVYGMGVASGDFDNDGLPDIYLTAVGHNRLFRNLGEGRFVDATDAAGVAGGEGSWSTSSAFVDFDNDGDLDLFVCNYVEWTRELDLKVNYQLSEIGRAYGPPFEFSGAFPFLFENQGNGRFENVAAGAGIEIVNGANGTPLAKSLGVSPVDIDSDGWIDFVVANDTVQNFVFLNQRDCTFKEIGARSGIAFDSFGATRGAMGIDAAFAAHDGDLSIAIGNFANETTSLYVARRDPFLFSDEAIVRGVGSPSREHSTFGVFFFDFDLDGWQDLLAVNGHIEIDVGKLSGSQAYRQPAQLFWNSGGMGTSQKFIPLSAEDVGGELFEPMVGRGAAFADVDNDGDLDVALTQINGPMKLLINEGKPTSNWLRVKLIGTRANRDAIGAWVEVRASGRTIRRQVMPAKGYLSQSELPVTIGLGSGTKVDSVTVVWPGGRKQIVKDWKPGEAFNVVEPNS